MNARLPFLSLLWKAIIGCSFILLAMVMLYTYYNVAQLNALQDNQRMEHHRDYITQFTGLMDRSAQSLSNIVDTLPALHDTNESLAQRIENNWFTLQLTWGIEGAELFDEKGKSLAKWGNTWLNVAEADLAAAREFGTRSRFVSCSQQCFLSLVSPVLDANDTLYVLRVTVSMADMILDFRNISRADIGFLVQRHGMLRPAKKSNRWEIALMSNRERLEPLFHALSLEHPLPEDLPESRLQQKQETEAFGDTYDVLFLADKSLLGRDASVVFITNISDIKARIENSRNDYIKLGLLISVITAILIAAALWRPLILLRLLAKALPMLPQGKFDEAEEQLAQAHTKRMFRDELSELKGTTIAVSKQLAGFREHIQANHKRLRELAHFDPLTGLINRSYLSEVLENNYLNQNGGSVFALIIIDLDNFKHINEGFGHTFGDQLLVHITQRLSTCLTDEDCAARLGGDEFCLICKGVEDEPSLTIVIQRIQRCLEELFIVEQRHIPVSCSIGAVLAPEHGLVASELLQKADLALYRAKAEGKNTFVLFSLDLLSDADARLALETELRSAVKEQQFELHYQPQLALDTGEMIGVEALIRWQHPKRGLLAPFFFIDALESNGLIVPVGKWVIETACKQWAQWSAKGYASLCMSINLSVRQFSDPHLMDTIRKSVERYQVDPRYLEFEVTESLLATNINYAIDLLNALRQIGCTIAIDDFGTGYSSLAYLKQLPLDKLKVDRAFVKDIPEDHDDRQICTAIIAMAKSLGLKVVAEGIETEAQLEFLLGLCCEIGQGYLFDKPVSADDIEARYLQQ